LYALALVFVGDKPKAIQEMNKIFEWTESKEGQQNRSKLPFDLLQLKFKTKVPN